jgi:hypothetical protein
MQYLEISLARAKEDLGKARDADSYLDDLNLNKLSNAPLKTSERESGRMSPARKIWGCSRIADRNGRQMGQTRANAGRV